LPALAYVTIDDIELCTCKPTTTTTATTTPPPTGRRGRRAAAAVAAAGAAVGASGMHVMWLHWLQGVRISCAWRLQLINACGPALAVSQRDVMIWRVLQVFGAVTQVSMW
jgi:hypothetical protein